MDSHKLIIIPADATISSYNMTVTGVVQPGGNDLADYNSEIWINIISNSIQYQATRYEVPPKKPKGSFDLLSTAISASILRAGATHEINFIPPLGSI
jgi:hypothetical protein